MFIYLLNLCWVVAIWMVPCGVARPRKRARFWAHIVLSVGLCFCLGLKSLWLQVGSLDFTFFGLGVPLDPQKGETFAERSTATKKVTLFLMSRQHAQAKPQREKHQSG